MLPTQLLSVLVLRVLFDFVVDTRSNLLGAGISDSRPSQKTRRTGHPTVLVMPATSKAWPPATRESHPSKNEGWATRPANGYDERPLTTVFRGLGIFCTLTTVWDTGKLSARLLDRKRIDL